ncbi:D-alanine--D-alanine ligase family protein [Gleimia europaea]|uniref:D-alanine--D-alanine ligase n=1 Tax=Gleimia europaea ACS-120-V-Col10b TaxID=883069 RepID=A0A9W5RF50_9ACTO|nr:D-alanine--D-alanine ligase [Gleimia europaea]EPD31333.1 D-alanine-D-alanine ligase [Gleimia europaea ACS-120-V-Col10b]
MSEALKILVVSGGLTHERDVSLRSGRRVATVLRHAGHTVEVCDLNAQFLPTVAEFEPDVVWPLIHGSVGEDGSVQDLLELISFPYVGSTAASCALASSKPTAKSLAQLSGVVTPKWLSLKQALFRQVGAPAIIQSIVDNEAGLTFPLIVKPADGGSALGLSKVFNEEELRSAMVDAFAYGDTVMVEQFIPGKEIAVSVLDLGEPVALPPVEIETDDGRYDYDARYNTGRSKFFVPARLSEEELAAVCDVALKVHKTVGMRHLSRIDLILGEDGTVWFIDANVSPGMTDTSLFPLAAEEYGSLSDVLEDIARYAAENQS